MIWNEEDEIWKSNGEIQRPYGHQTFLPDVINNAHNQGKPGAYYPDHEDYYKGKSGHHHLRKRPKERLNLRVLVIH